MIAIIIMIIFYLPVLPSSVLKWLLILASTQKRHYFAKCSKSWHEAIHCFASFICFQYCRQMEHLMAYCQCWEFTTILQDMLTKVEIRYYFKSSMITHWMQFFRVYTCKLCMLAFLCKTLNYKPQPILQLWLALFTNCRALFPIVRGFVVPQILLTNYCIFFSVLELLQSTWSHGTTTFMIS